MHLSLTFNTLNYMQPSKIIVVFREQAKNCDCDQQKCTVRVYFIFVQSTQLQYIHSRPSYCRYCIFPPQVSVAAEKFNGSNHSITTHFPVTISVQ